MQIISFLGGALTGAAGLVAAAMWDSQRTEQQFSPKLKEAAKQDIETTIKLLNNYFFSAQEHYVKCNEILLESWDLISTPIELPDDGIFQKAANLMGGSANRLCRGWRENELKNLREEVWELYRRYGDVFIHANKLLAQIGKPQVDLNSLKMEKGPLSIDNSLENENWDKELMQLGNTITGYIEQACKKAEELIDLLELDAGVRALTA